MSGVAAHQRFTSVCLIGTHSPHVVTPFNNFFSTFVSQQIHRRIPSTPNLEHNFPILIVTSQSPTVNSPYSVSNYPSTISINNSQFTINPPQSLFSNTSVALPIPSFPFMIPESYFFLYNPHFTTPLPRFLLHDSPL